MQKHKGLEDPLEVVGLEIADEAILLCLDEFMVCECDAHLYCLISCSGKTHVALLLYHVKVNDVADALILNRLFRHLFNNGIVSNL